MGSSSRYAPRLWNIEFFTFIGLELGKFLEISSMTMERANLSKIWLKLEVPNREVIPNILEVESPMGLLLINISPFPCVDGTFTAILGHQLLMHEVPVGLGAAIQHTAEEERSTTHNAAVHQYKGWINTPGRGRLTPLTYLDYLLPPPALKNPCSFVGELLQQH